jgi:hypothetical protein
MIVQAICMFRAGMAIRSERLKYSLPMKSQFVGQVGQESNLHPAGLEHSARYPASSKVVQYCLELAVLGDTSSSGVQAHPTAL